MAPNMLANSQQHVHHLKKKPWQKHILVHLVRIFLQASNSKTSARSVTFNSITCDRRHEYCKTVLLLLFSIGSARSVFPVVSKFSSLKMDIFMGVGGNLLVRAAIFHNSCPIVTVFGRLIAECPDTCSAKNGRDTAKDVKAITSQCCKFESSKVWPRS
jgi:hypothetical protein